MRDYVGSSGNVHSMDCSRHTPPAFSFLSIWNRWIHFPREKKHSFCNINGIVEGVFIWSKWLSIDAKHGADSTGRYRRFFRRLRRLRAGRRRRRRRCCDVVARDEPVPFGLVGWGPAIGDELLVGGLEGQRFQRAPHLPQVHQPGDFLDALPQIPTGLASPKSIQYDGAVPSVQNKIL